ncbi:HTTM domain-containing protein [Tautonia sociabilis]|uniref:HTTM domain-containing protein n=1 Tax=Tautonia sociabilis TaxID=2080755 RepID=A0A432MNI6_9BACT|nr:HTTM domain-containing protein [Tautonia sociabilis]RUL88747.1 HTTM domain-containing protein [Tautonia sociabilis]
MRRILTVPAVRGLVERSRSFAEGWNAFWFTPADPTLTGVLRVLTGLMLLYTHAVWGLALDDFFGPTPWLSAEMVRDHQQFEFAYSFWWWVEPEWMWTAHGLSLAILALFTVGLWTRVTSVLALIVAISYANRVPMALFGLDQINVMLTLYLTIGDGGRAVSLDRWLARRRGKGPATPSARANLGRRLIQIHMCVIYFFAGVSKLQGPSWWDGEAMWLAFANLEYQSMDMTWLAWHPLLLNAMTHATVLWEVFFCALVWNRWWRPVMLGCGTAMHLGIGACLGMWTFGLIMLVGCASFLPDEVARSIVSAFSRRRAGRPARVAIPAAAVPASAAAKTGHRPMGAVVSVDYGRHRSPADAS